jgi:phage tail-like protein
MIPLDRLGAGPLDRPGAGPLDGLGAGLAQPALTVAHVADFYRRYPGEAVTFYTRVEVLRTLPGYRLSVSLPPGLEMAAYQAPPAHGLPQIIQREDGGRAVTWHLVGPLEPGARHEYQVQATVRPTQQDTTLQSRAVVAWKNDGLQDNPDQETIRRGTLAQPTHQGRPSTATPSGLQDNPDQETIRRGTLAQPARQGQPLTGTRSVAETAYVAVVAKGRYLRYLPALYADDELMGRFLMLFESFWAPIERTIDQLPFYLDPRTAPPDLLPWLACWLDLVLDERWPEEKRRRLLRSAVTLYRKRGTRQGLREYLEIYTGQVPLILEHRAHNFRIGPDARLGPGIALGTENVPHTFAVVLRLPPMRAQDGRAAEQQEEERRYMIERIIEAEKPAHTAYTLRIEAVPS